MSARNVQRDRRIVFIAPTPGRVEGLWDIELSDGTWRFNVPSDEVRQEVTPGAALAQCPHCRASRWYGLGPCGQCEQGLFDPWTPADTLASSDAAGTQVPGGNRPTVRSREGVAAAGEQVPGGNPAASPSLNAEVAP